MPHKLRGREVVRVGGGEIKKILLKANSRGLSMRFLDSGSGLYIKFSHSVLVSADTVRGES